MSQPQGTLFVVSAPSGAGKTSLITAMVEEMSNLVISLSYTTREKRPAEIDGVHYNFITQDVFDDLAAKNEFLESATVFGHSYGTSKRWIEERLARGLDILLEIDWQGARQIKQLFPEKSVSIFILPPSLMILETRLRARKQDSNEVIAHRMDQAKAEIAHYSEYDYLVINDDFHNARRDLKAILNADRLRFSKQQLRYAEMLGQFVVV